MSTSVESPPLIKYDRRTILALLLRWRRPACLAVGPGRDRPCAQTAARYGRTEKKTVQNDVRGSSANSNTYIYAAMQFQSFNFNLEWTQCHAIQSDRVPAAGVCGAVAIGAARCPLSANRISPLSRAARSGMRQMSPTLKPNLAKLQGLV